MSDFTIQNYKEAPDEYLDISNVVFDVFLPITSDSVAIGTRVKGIWDNGFFALSGESVIELSGQISESEISDLEEYIQTHYFGYLAETI